MISFGNELDIRKWPNKGIDLIGVIATITVTFIDGLNHIRCLVLDLKLLKKKGQFYIVLPNVFLGLSFCSCLFPCLVCSVHLQRGELDTSGLQVCWLLLV